jgi:hypothetical protein
MLYGAVKPNQTTCPFHHHMFHFITSTRARRQQVVLPDLSRLASPRLPARHRTVVASPRPQSGRHVHALLDLLSQRRVVLYIPPRLFPVHNDRQLEGPPCVAISLDILAPRPVCIYVAHLSSEGGVCVCARAGGRF